MHTNKRNSVNTPLNPIIPLGRMPISFTWLKSPATTATVLKASDCLVSSKRYVAPLSVCVSKLRMNSYPRTERTSQC